MIGEEGFFGLNKNDFNFGDKKDPLKQSEYENTSNLKESDFNFGVSRKIGHSKYDEGILVGQDPNKVRAEKQGLISEVANSAARLLPDIFLTITENAGYLFEIPFIIAGDRDFSNALVDWSKKGKEYFREELPAYRENPEEVFDFSDSAWWVNHGTDLVSSIASFLVTGAGVGMGLGKGASAGARLLGNSLKAQNYLGGAAQGLTSSTLAYVEGAMSGSEVYKQVLEDQLDKDIPLEEAQQVAGKAAAHTVTMNTVANSFVNVSAVSPMFKSSKYIRQYLKDVGINRGATEQGSDYLKRLIALGEKGVIPKSKGLVSVSEALQEATEEQVNLFSESEGKLKGGLIKDDRPWIERLEASLTSEEGALASILGAAGGVGQTLGMRNLPVHKLNDNGKTTRVSADAKETILANKKLADYINTFKQDLTKINELHKELALAVESGDDAKRREVNSALFNVAALKSVGNGTSQELANDFEKIANTDNETLGEDGKTDAMRLGYADSQKDNTYKELAVRRVSTLKYLSDRYEDIVPRYNKDMHEEAYGEELFIKEANLHIFKEFQKELAIKQQDVFRRLDEFIDEQKLDTSISAGLKENVRLEALKSQLKEYKTNRKAALARANLHRMPNEKKKADSFKRHIDSLNKAIRELEQANKNTEQAFITGKQLTDETLKTNNLKREFRESTAIPDMIKDDLIEWDRKIIETNNNAKDKQDELNELASKEGKEKFVRNHKRTIADVEKQIKAANDKIKANEQQANDEQARKTEAENIKTTRTRPAREDRDDTDDMDNFFVVGEGGKRVRFGDTKKQEEGKPERKKIDDSISPTEEIPPEDKSKNEPTDILPFGPTDELFPEGTGEQVEGTGHTKKIGDSLFDDSHDATRTKDEEDPFFTSNKDLAQARQLIEQTLKDNNIWLKRETANAVANLKRNYKTEDGYASGDADNETVEGYNRDILTTAIKKGDKITIEIDKQNELYEETKDNIDLVPMVVKKGNDVIGYVHNTIYTSNEKRTLPWTKDNEDNLAVQTEAVKKIRQAVAKLGKVETFINLKTDGYVSTDAKDKIRPVNEGVGKRKFYLAKGGMLFQNRYNPHNEEISNHPDSLVDGGVYHIEKSPTGELIAFPTGKQTIGETGFKDSIINAIKVFLGRVDISENQLNLLRHLDMDITTSQGLENYLNNFLFIYYKLSDKATQEALKKDLKGNKFYFNITDDSFMFQKNGANLYRLRKDVVQDYDKPLNALLGYLDNALFNVNATKMDSGAMSLPLLNLGETGLEVESIPYGDYATFIGDHLTTNVVSTAINPEQERTRDNSSVFDQPSLHFDTNFVKRAAVPDLDVDVVQTTKEEFDEAQKKAEKDRTRRNKLTSRINLPGSESEGTIESVVTDPDLVEKLDKHLDKFLVSGYTSQEQQSIINIMLYDAITAINKGQTKTLKDAFENFRKAFQEDADEYGDPAVLKLLKNFDKLVKVAKVSAFSTGLIRADGTLNEDEPTEIPEDIDNIDEDSAFNTIEQHEHKHFNTNQALKEDYKKNVSGRIRQVLSFAQEMYVTDDNKVRIKYNNAFGEALEMPSFFRFDEIYNDLSVILADTPPIWEDMRRKMLDQVRRKPYVYGVIQAIENDPKDADRLKIQFVQAMSKTYAKHLAVLWKLRRNGYDIQVLESNRNTLKAVIEKEWRENMKMTNLVEKVDGQFKLKPEKIQELKEEYEQILENYKNAKKREHWVPSLDAWLKKMGVHLHESTLSNLTTGKIKVGRTNQSILSHLTSNTGIFKSMYNRLLVKEDAENTDNLLYLNNPLTSNDGVNLLAQEEAKHNVQSFSNSWRNINGDLVYGYTLNREMTIKYREFMNPMEASRLYKYPGYSNTQDENGQPYYKNWLYRLSSREDSPEDPNDSLFQSTFKLTMTDGLKKGGSYKSGKEITKMDKSDLAIFKLALFQNGTKIGDQNTARFVRLVPGKQTAFIIEALKEDISVVVEDGAVQDINAKTMNALFSIADSEMRRIYDFNIKGLGKDVKGYKDGAGKFWYFSQLNDLTFTNKDTGEEESIFDAEGKLRLRSEIIEAVREKVRELALRGIDNQLTEWKNLGIVERTSLNFMTSNYKRNQKGLTKTTTANRAALAAADYYINTLLANYNAQQVFSGDPALFTKKDYASTVANIFKRLQKDIAPRTDFVKLHRNEVVRYISLKDRKIASRNISNYKSKLGDAVGYDSIESTDSQELTTLREHIHVMYRTSKLDTNFYNKMLERIDRQGSNLVLSPSELRKVFGAHKPVYAGMKYDTIPIEQYVKSSSIPLIPQYTRGTALDNLRRSMEKAENPGAGIYVRAAYDSATKLGGKESAPVFNKDGTTKNLDLTKFAIDVSRDGFGIQQEIPYKEGHKEIVKGTQNSKLLITAALLDDKFKQLRSNWEQKHKELYENAKDLLSEDIIGENGELDVRKLQDRLLKEAYERNLPPNVIYGLALIPNDAGVEEFVGTLWASPYANKYESLIISMFNKVAKQRMPGRSYNLVSEEGWTTGDGVSGGMVYTSAYDGQGLKPMRVEEGVVKPAQILLPWNFTDSKGNLLDIEQFTKEVDGKKMLDMDKISEDVLKAFGFRIPTSWHNLMGGFEVVGFFPGGQDIAITSRDFINQAGWDFDADKLYMYQYNTSLVGGVLTKYKAGEDPNTEESRKRIQNDLIDLHLEAILTPEIYDNIVKPLSYDGLEELANSVSSENELLKNEPFISDLVQNDKFIESKNSGVGIGVKSLDSVFVGLALGKDIEIQTLIPRLGPTADHIIFTREDGMSIRGSKIGGKDSKGSLIMGEGSVLAEISEYQNANLDSPEILGKINSNEHTYDAERAIIMVGFPKEIAVGITAQPIIRELAEARYKNRSDSNQYYKSDSELIDDIVSRYEQEHFGLYKKNILEGQEDEVYLRSSLPLKQSEMYDAIDESKENTTKSPEYYQVQLKALYKFLHAERYGKAIGEVQRLTNLDSKGIGINLLEAIESREKLTKLITEFHPLKNIENLFTENTIPGMIIRNGLEFAIDKTLRGRNPLFPYYHPTVRSIFNEIEQFKDLTASHRRTIFNAMKSWIFSSNTMSVLQGENVMELRKKLLLENDTPSLARVIAEFKQKTNNTFIQSLITDIAADSRQVSTVTFPASAGENVDEGNIYRDFVELITSPREIKEGYTTADLALDLLKYSLVTGNIQKANEFVKYFPIPYLSQLGINEDLRNFGFNPNAFGHTENIGDVTQFVVQLFQHFPEFAYRLTDDDLRERFVVTEETEDGIPIVLNSKNLPLTEEVDFNEYTPLVKRTVRGDKVMAPIELFAVFDPDQNKRYRVYARYKTLDDGVYEYVLISTLGGRFSNEFTPNPEDKFASSILPSNNNIIITEQGIEEAKPVLTEDEQREIDENEAIFQSIKTRGRFADTPVGKETNDPMDTSEFYGEDAVLPGEDQIHDDSAQQYRNTNTSDNNPTTNTEKTSRKEEPPTPLGDSLFNTNESAFAIPNVHQPDILEQKFGRTAFEALDRISQGSTRWKELADYLKNFDLNGVILSVEQLRPGVAGNITDNKIVFNKRFADTPKTGDLFADTITHEVIHYLTRGRIKAFRDGKLRGEQAAIVQRLDSLRKFVINQFNEEQKAEFEEYQNMLDQARRSKDQFLFNTEERTRMARLASKYYALTDLDEFVAGVMTSSDFQYRLEGLKSPYHENKSVLERFIDLVRKLMEAIVGRPIKQGTVLSDALAASISLIDSTPDINYTTDSKTTLESVVDSYSDYNKFTSNIRSRINRLQNAKAKSKGNNVRISYYNAKIRELEDELSDFIDEASIGRVLDVYERDLDRVENILAKDTVDIYDWQLATETLKMWENVLNFVLDEEQKEDYDLPAYREAKRLDTIREDYLNRLTNIGGKLLVDAINKDSIKKVTLNDVLGPQREVGQIAGSTLDVSRYGNDILNNISKWVRDASYDTNQEAIVMQDELSKHYNAIKSTVEFKADGYKIFAQTDKNGKPNGNFVTKENFAYSEERRKQREVLYQAEHTQEERQKYFDWLRENHVYVNLNELYEEDEDGYLIKKENPQYIAQLKRDLSKEELPETAEELIAEQDKLIEEYNDRLEAETVRVSEETPEYANTALSAWKYEYSPLIAYDIIKGNSRGSIRVAGRYINNRGYDHTVAVSKSKWRDSKYLTIQNNEALKGYYDFMMNTMNDLFKYLPTRYIEKFGRKDFMRVIPEIPKSVIEAYNEKGFRSGATGLSDWFKKLISDSTQESLAAEDGMSLKVRGVPMGIDPESKSYDLSKVLSIFSLSALAYKHKSKVEDHILLAQTILSDAKEMIVDSKGNPISDDGALRTKDGLKNINNSLNYMVNSFYGKRTEVQGRTGIKVKTSEQKALEKELLEIHNTPAAERTEEQELRLSVIQNRIAMIEREITGSAIGDQILQYVQMKGMGWNVFSAVTNVLFGLSSNLVWSGGGEEFNTGQLLKANRIMLSSIRGGKSAKKLERLVRKYDVVKEINEASYTSTFRDPNKSSRMYMPYELHRKGELFVQGQTMVAMMLNTKIADKNGKEHTLWEAYDENGSLKEQFKTESNVRDWETVGKGREAKNFKQKMDQTLKSIHGNYDSENSPVYIKSGFLGRATLQFRSWVAEGVANRFEGEKYDELLGRRRKGRYITFGKAFISLFTDYKRLMAGEVLSAVDKANMYRNMVEAIQFATLTAVYLGVKALDLDDEDDKRVTNYALNTILRIKSDIEFYVSPVAFENITRNALPIFSLLVDLDHFTEAGIKALNGEDIIETGPYAGESRTARYGAKLFPLSTQYYRLRSATEQVFDK